MITNSKAGAAGNSDESQKKSAAPAAKGKGKGSATKKQKKQRVPHVKFTPELAAQNKKTEGTIDKLFKFFSDPSGKKLDIAKCARARKRMIGAGKKASLAEKSTVPLIRFAAGGQAVWKEWEAIMKEAGVVDPFCPMLHDDVWRAMRQLGLDHPEYVNLVGISSKCPKKDFVAMMSQLTGQFPMYAEFFAQISALCKAGVFDLAANFTGCSTNPFLPWHCNSPCGKSKQLKAEFGWSWIEDIMAVSGIKNLTLAVNFADQGAFQKIFPDDDIVRLIHYYYCAKDRRLNRLNLYRLCPKKFPISPQELHFLEGIYYRMSSNAFGRWRRKDGPASNETQQQSNEEQFGPTSWRQYQQETAPEDEWVRGAKNKQLKTRGDIAGHRLSKRWITKSTTEAGHAGVNPVETLIPKMHRLTRVCFLRTGHSLADAD